jgi:riboflavin synthase
MGGGATLNLEPALKLGDELGGHIVTGHVDGVGTVVSVGSVGDSIRVIIAAPPIWRPISLKRLDHGRWRLADGQRHRRSGRWHLPLCPQHHPHTAKVTTAGQWVEGRRSIWRSMFWRGI